MVAAMTLAGCGTSGQQKADYASVHRAGVPAPLYDKMVRGNSLTIADAITLSKAGVDDAIIVRYIRDQGTVYRLTRRDFAWLRQGGVSQSVIDFMDHTDYRGPDSPWGP
jgi:hypothetical protein